MEPNTENPLRSTIKRVPAQAFLVGCCVVCNQVALLKWLDTTTGWAIGDCCAQAVVDAERFLQCSNVSLRAPTAVEAFQMPNH